MSTDNFTTFTSGKGKGKKRGSAISFISRKENSQPALIINYCNTERSTNGVIPVIKSNSVTLTDTVYLNQNSNLTTVLDYVINILKVRRIVVKAANIPVNAVASLEKYIYEIAESQVVKQLWDKGEELFVYGYLNGNKITTLSSVNNIETSTAS